MFNISTTVLPTRAGGFPPATFFTFSDAYDYMREVQEEIKGKICGVTACPAGSFQMYWDEAVKRPFKEEFYNDVRNLAYRYRRIDGAFRGRK